MREKPVAEYRVRMTVAASYDYDLQTFEEVVTRGIHDTLDLEITLLDIQRIPAVETP